MALKKRDLSARIVPPILLMAAAAGVAADSWTCRQAALTRHVLVYYPQAPAPLPCEVFYTKPGERVMPRPLWEATNTEGYCERKAAGFVRRLASWGWHCTPDEAEQEKEGFSIPTQLKRLRDYVLAEGSV